MLFFSPRPLHSLRPWSLKARSSLTTIIFCNTTVSMLPLVERFKNATLHRGIVPPKLLHYIILCLFCQVNFFNKLCKCSAAHKTGLTITNEQKQLKDHTSK